MHNPSPKETTAPGGDLAVRVLSALALASPVLAAVWSGGVVFVAAVLLGFALAAWEWSRLCLGRGQRHAEVLLISGMAGAVVATALGWLMIALGILGVTAGTLAVSAGNAAKCGRVWLAAGAFYVGLPAMALVWLRLSHDDGFVVILWLMLVVWATDVGAYAFGRLLGGPKLIPSLSPKKTWAGLLGGALCAAGVGALTAWLLESETTNGFVALSAALAVVAQAGDFFESGVKRHFGVKDSSSLIPGHGGLLDRIDGLMAAACVAALLHLLGGEGVLP